MDRSAEIRDVVRRLVDHYRPERVYLVGSAARGDDGPESDLDFVVVLPDDAPREAVMGGGVYRALRGVPCSVDVVPFRRRAFEQRADWVMSLPAIALREGKLEYDASAAAV